jgi:hypothetical protein
MGPGAIFFLLFYRIKVGFVKDVQPFLNERLPGMMLL